MTNYDLKIIKDNFQNIKANIKKIINDDKIYDDFIKNILFYSVINEKIVLLVPNNFIKSTIENNYAEQFKKGFSDIIKNKLDITFMTQDEIVTLEQSNKKKNSELTTPVSNGNTNTNSSLSFDNFYVAPFNKSAYNAIRTIFNTKQIWNPIFISGGVGLGKTHLLHAAGNEYIKLHPVSSIKYVTSDAFVREIYNALSSKDSNAIEILKDKYQSYDLLLIDDIQFLAKKEKINEIFFNIFNHNISHNKIIIITSDKHPDELENFEPRMISRFTSGLHIQITKPTIEAMVNILEMKVKEEFDGYVISPDAINYMVRRNQDDIRKLEGYLHKVMFYAYNNLSPDSIITVSIVQAATEVTDYSRIKANGYSVDPQIVIDQICSTYGVDPKQVKSKSRKRQISNARHVCQYVLRKKFAMPYEEIGSYFGNRNHSTIIESINKIEQTLQKDENLKNYIEKIYKNI